MYEDPLSGHESFALHRVVARNNDELTFESYGPRVASAPLPGSVFFYRGWWVKAAMAAALDTAAEWKRLRYPNDGSHEHCLFSWETIASYAPACSAYFSEPMGGSPSKPTKSSSRKTPIASGEASRLTLHRAASRGSQMSSITPPFLVAGQDRVSSLASRRAGVR